MNNGRGRIGVGYGMVGVGYDSVEYVGVKKDRSVVGVEYGRGKVG